MKNSPTSSSSYKKSKNRKWSIDNTVIKDIPEEDNNRLKISKKYSGSKYTVDKEITAEELEEFHKDGNNNDSDDDVDVDGENADSHSKEELKYLKFPEIKHEGELKQRFPQAIIAGVKKCGTRALLSFLAKHPLVKSAGREMHFFDKNDSYSNGLEWYRQQMPESYENEITIEKTPGYFVKSYVPKRVYDFAQKFNKDLKLIFIFRDPVERAISDYTQTLANKDETIRIEKLIFSKKNSKRTVSSKKSLISIGLYANHLWNWLEYFAKVKMLFVDGDEFIKNPVPGIMAVQKFLNLPVLINQHNFVYNETKRFYCFRRLDDDNKIQEHCLGDSKGRKHPEIRDGTRRKLVKFYKPHNKKFFEMINKDFGWPTPDDDDEK